MMHSLPLFVKLDGAPVILIGAGEAAQAKRRLIERADGVAIGPDDAAAAQARLAFIALDDVEAATVAAAQLKARGLLVNVVDQPSLCDFTSPAIVDRDPVLIAISTGGASAGLAKALRQRLETLLPAKLGDLAQALGKARSTLRARWPGARARRGALDDALTEGGPLDPLSDHDDNAVAQWMTSDGDQSINRVETVQLTSADPDELTLRAARLLGRADRIIHDGAVPPILLARARADAARHILPNDAAADDLPGLTVRLILAHRSTP